MSRMIDMTWQDFRDAMSRNPVLLIPCGAVEQHGPHLPLGTDVMLATAVAEGVAARIDGIACQAVNYGYKSMPRSGGGQSFPGTTSMDGETVIHQVRDLIREYHRHGARRLCFVDGHYENQWFVSEGIQVALRELADPSLKIVRLEYWDFLSETDIERLFPDGFPGFALEHAAVLETAFMLHLRPDLVREDKIPQEVKVSFPLYDVYPEDSSWVPEGGALSGAASASADLGRELYDIYVKGIGEALVAEFSLDA